MKKQIKRALISVFHKEGLEEIVRQLHRLNVELVSTGGTQEFIENLGIPCIAVETLTDFPSMLGGRVKTLHPAIFGGILARRDNESDMDQVSTYDLQLIDLVIVDLYPFEATVRSGASEAEIIEKIDIGGISLIRGAAKNFDDVLIVSSRNQYADLLSLLQEQEGCTTREDRMQYAREAFAESSRYDSAIYNYFLGEASGKLRIAHDQTTTLRYGENPHQNAYFAGNLDEYLQKIQGKEVSYNNLLDITAAVSLIQEFSDPTFVIIKHTNPCGVATRASIHEAWKEALSCDPESAFGGILVANGTIDKETAEEINQLFFEVLIAPDYTSEALEVFASKSKRIVLKSIKPYIPQTTIRSAVGGYLVQENDNGGWPQESIQCATHKEPTEKELADLKMSNIIAKHCKSNAVALVKDAKLCASGVGQTSRVASLRQSIEKAQSFGFSLQGAVLASDAFFPFSDCVELAAQHGITAIVQPGGSLRDNDSIEACNKHNIAMLLTGERHFRH